MVSRVKNVDNKYIIDENGEPIIIINLSIMTHLYSEDIEELLHHISHSISHELFHLIFAKYRDISPYWKTEKDNTEIESLIEIIPSVAAIIKTLTAKNFFVFRYNTPFTAFSPAFVLETICSLLLDG